MKTTQEVMMGCVNIPAIVRRNTERKAKECRIVYYFDSELELPEGYEITDVKWKNGSLYGRVDLGINDCEHIVKYSCNRWAGDGSGHDMVWNVIR